MSGSASSLGCDGQAKQKCTVSKKKKKNHESEQGGTIEGSATNQADDRRRSTEEHLHGCPCERADSDYSSPAVPPNQMESTLCLNNRASLHQTIGTDDTSIGTDDTSIGQDKGGDCIGQREARDKLLNAIAAHPTHQG